jgi:hypothetical protein
MRLAGHAADDEHGAVWLTIEDVAALARRAPSTIRNLVSHFQLRRRLGYRTYRRGARRRRIILVSPGVASWLVRVTLLGERPENPPT